MSETLEQFKEKRSEWIECLNSDDQHSIRNQVIRLMWDSAVLRTTGAAIELAPRDEDGNPKLCGAIVNAFSRWGAASQSLAIRRLTEKYNPDRDKHQKKAVYSLHWLISDILTNVALFTRENLFAAEGLECDISKVETAHRNWQQQKRREIHEIPAHLDSDGLAARHAFFNKIAGPKPRATGEAGDVISSFLLNDLLAMLEKCKAVKGHVNKYIAHAATPESLKHLDKKAANLTYGEIWKAEKIICQVYSLLLKILCDVSTSLVVLDMGNEFYYIENGWVSAEDAGKVREAGRAFKDETEGWLNWNGQALLKPASAAATAT